MAHTSLAVMPDARFTPRPTGQTFLEILTPQIQCDTPGDKLRGKVLLLT
jgi:hypothetical protein